MELQFNFFIIPVLVPLIVAGKTFLDQQDFKVAIQSMFQTKTILLFLLGLFAAFLLQTFFKGSLLTVQ